MTYIMAPLTHGEEIIRLRDALHDVRSTMQAMNANVDATAKLLEQTSRILTGNGEPDKGIVHGVQKLQWQQSLQTWVLVTFLGGAVTAGGMKMMEWLKPGTLPAHAAKVEK